MIKPRLSTRRRVMLYVAGWLPIVLLYSLALRTVVPSYLFALLYSASYFVPGIVIGAGVWWIAGRVPWRKLGWGRAVATELGLTLGFLIAWQAAFAAWLWVFAGPAVAKANSWLVLFAGADDAGSGRDTLGWALLLGLLMVTVHSAAFHVVRIFGDFREKELAAAEAEALRVRAEMQALRGQLNPHFLFNSLHSIIALVREDAGRAEEALLQFSTLLRRVLDVNRNTADEVELADEIKFIDDYLAIERLRLGERLRVTQRISAAALECWVPAFSVQPLVENAIHHAIAPRREGGDITLTAEVQNETLVIRVADNGPGADAAALVAAAGVGLAAIRRRLALRHGAEAAVDVQTRPGAGFAVQLTLPAHLAPLMEARA